MQDDWCVVCDLRRWKKGMLSNYSMQVAQTYLEGYKLHVLWNVHTSLYIYLHIYVYMYICIYVYMYICIYVYMYICIYVYMYICRVYVYMYICMHNTGSSTCNIETQSLSMGKYDGQI